MDQIVHRQSCELAFADTDASGWMYFPNIFKYVEIAEQAYLRQQGILVFDRNLGGWPRVKVSCQYKRPFLFGDKIEVRLAIERIGASSLTWKFEVVNANGELSASGGLTTVRVDNFGRPQIISATERQQLEAGIPTD